jgi:hypothetical protein
LVDDLTEHCTSYQDRQKGPDPSIVVPGPFLFDECPDLYCLDRFSTGALNLGDHVARDVVQDRLIGVDDPNQLDRHTQSFRRFRPSYRVMRVHYSQGRGSSVLS